MISSKTESVRTIVACPASLVQETDKDVENTNNLSRIKLSATEHFFNKDIISAPVGHYRSWANSLEFIKHNWTPYDIASHITQGRAISPAVYRDQHRSTENFVSSQLIVIDIDKGNHSIESLTEDKFIREHAFLIHPTTNSKPDAIRSRIFFRLDKQIDDSIAYKDFVKKLIEWFAIHYSVDTTCDDACQIFYGTKTEKFIFWPENILPIAILNSFLPPTMDNEQFHRNVSGDKDDVFNEHFAEYVDEVKTRLLVLRPRLAQGKHVKCPNPVHPDKHPSFRISYERDKILGIPICTCGKLNWKKVGDWIGLCYEAWRDQNLHKKSAGTVQLFANSLDNAFREYLIKKGFGNVARLLDAALILGMKSGQQFSESEIFKLLEDIQIARKTVKTILMTPLPIVDSNGEIHEYPIFRLNEINRAKSTTVDLADSSRKLDEVVYDLNYVSDCNDNCVAVMQQPPAAYVTNANGNINHDPAQTEPIIPKRRGRPANSIYTFPDQYMVMDYLGIKPINISDQISLEDAKSGKSYRSALNYKLIERREGIYTNAWRSARLNVDKSTLWRYDRDSKIVKTTRIDLTPLNSSNVYELLMATDEKYKAANYEYLIDKNGHWYRPELGNGLMLIQLNRDPCLVQYRAGYCAIAEGYGDVSIVSAEGKPRQMDVKFRETTTRLKAPKMPNRKGRVNSLQFPQIMFSSDMSEHAVLSTLYREYLWCVQREAY